MGDPRTLEAPQLPWQNVHMDWLSGIPPDKEGRDTILVFIDALTGMVHLQACKKTDTSKDTARHFVHNVVRLHGMPEVVVSDRDIRLRANFWRALQARLGVDLRFTTRHNPNANGKVERINLVLADVLRSLCSFSGQDWSENLDLAEFAINGAENSATGMSPFKANTGRDPPVPADVGKPARDTPAAAEFADAMFATVLHARDSLERAKRKYEAQLQQERRPAEVFAAGESVLLDTKTLDLRMQARKLTSRFVGPFKVLEPPHNHRPANPNCVYLETPTSLKIHMPVNIKSVKRYHTRPARLGGPVDVIPEPLVVQGVDLWEVDEILAERLSTPKGRRKTAKPEHQVLVKWTGFHLLDATWEPLQNMPDAVIAKWRELQAGC